MEKIKNIQQHFYATVELIQALPKEGPIDVDIETKLTLYGLFKTATIGENNTEKPSLWNIEESLKWQAWKERDFLPKKVAMYYYMQNVGEEIKKIFYSGKSDEYLQQTDMTWLSKLSKESLKILFNGVNDTDEAEQDIKNKMLELKNIYMPDL